MQAHNDEQLASHEASISESINKLATRRPRWSVCFCVVFGVLSIDVSYVALIGLNNNARSYLGHILPELLLVMPVPILIGGLVAFLMTYRSRLAATAGLLAAIVLSSAATLLAALNLLAIGSWGGDMQALSVAIDFVVLCAVALMAAPISYLCARSIFRDSLPKWRRADADRRRQRALEILQRRRHW